MAFRDPELLDPDVSSIARCSSCRHLFILGKDPRGVLDIRARDCPNCGQHLTVDAILSSHSTEVAVTKAVASANKLVSLDLVIVPMLGAGAIAAWIGYPLSLRVYFFLAYAFPLTVEVRWFYQHWYGRRFSDDEYIQAVNRMKISLTLWIAANGMNLALLFI